MKEGGGGRRAVAKAAACLCEVALFSHSERRNEQGNPKRRRPIEDNSLSRSRPFHNSAVFWSGV
ncbi:MAG: hypothetical protein LBG43_10660 [Treponema sp.]|nr:hypothetical protein [Treponema sp.]